MIILASLGDFLRVFTGYYHVMWIKFYSGLGLAILIFVYPSNAFAIGKVFLDLFSEVDGSEKEFNLIFEEKKFFGSSHHKLQVIAYEPKVSNGGLVLFSHGSMTNPNEARVTYRLLPWARKFNEQGYTFVIWMRAGRGASEGETEEYSGDDCNQGRTEWSLERNRAQLDQVINQLHDRYRFNSLFLVGHSRGGIISANYASHNPSKVVGVINLAGGYNQFCDPKNGNFSWGIIKDSLRFPRQRWIYYKDDKFFGAPYKEFVASSAKTAGIEFFDVPGGHGTPLLRPGWIPGALKWFDYLKLNAK